MDEHQALHRSQLRVKLEQILTDKTAGREIYVVPFLMKEIDAYVIQEIEYYVKSLLKKST